MSTYGPGHVTTDGRVEVFDGRNWRVMPPTLDPLTVALREFLATNPAPCACCGMFDCECGAADDWREAMDPDPHGDLAGLTDLELPY